MKKNRKGRGSRPDRVAAAKGPARLRTVEDELDIILFDVMEELATAMKLHGVTKSGLAKRLGTTSPAITRMMGGRQSPTLKSLCAAFNALGYRMEIKAQGMHIPANVRRTWQRQGLD